MIPFHPINLIDGSFLYEWVADNLISCGKDSAYYDGYSRLNKYTVDLQKVYGHYDEHPSHDYLFVSDSFATDLEMFTFALEWIGDDLRIDFDCGSDSAINCLGRLVYEFGGLPAGTYLIEW